MSDYNKWFISKDQYETAIKCKRERLIDQLKDILGPVRAAEVFPRFRQATFAEHCRLELSLLNDQLWHSDIKSHVLATTNQKKIIWRRSAYMNLLSTIIASDAQKTATIYSGLKQQGCCDRVYDAFMVKEFSVLVLVLPGAYPSESTSL